MSAANTPLVGLEDYRDVFVSRDLDETKQHIGGILQSHELEVLNSGQLLDVKVGRTDFGELSFMYIDHGADVHIYPGKLETIYLLQVPINADGQVRVGRSTISLSNKMAYIVSPTYDFEMLFSKNCSHMILAVNKVRLEKFLEQRLQRKLNVPLEFVPRIDFTNHHSHELISLIGHLTKQLNHPTSSFHHPLISAQIESLLFSTMLVSLEHNYRDELTSEAVSPKPYFIKKAQAYIEENAELLLTPEDISRESCVSLRSVYAGFRTYLHSTPMAYIKNVKLNRIREDLERCEPSAASVTDIALKYSISHFSNFAAGYKKKFGELPSETLRKRRI